MKFTHSITQRAVFIFVGFWSPFVAVGLAPFALLMCFRLGMKENVLIWQNWLAVILIGLPVISYLLTNTASVPHGMIWLNGCVSAGGPCFSWSGMAIFLAVVVGGSALVMLFCKVNIPAGFLISAIVTLVLIPFYLIGINNDFAMRASLPSIAILALTCALALTTATWPRFILPLAVMIIGLAVPISEAYRGLFVSRLDYSKYTFRDALAGIGEKKAQYFASSRVWVLRSSTDK